MFGPYARSTNGTTLIQGGFSMWESCSIAYYMIDVRRDLGVLSTWMVDTWSVVLVTNHLPRIILSYQSLYNPVSLHMKAEASYNCWQSGYYTAKAKEQTLRNQNRVNSKQSKELTTNPIRLVSKFHKKSFVPNSPNGSCYKDFYATSSACQIIVTFSQHVQADTRYCIYTII